MTESQHITLRELQRRVKSGAGRGGGAAPPAGAVGARA